MRFGNLFAKKEQPVEHNDAPEDESKHQLLNVLEQIKTDPKIYGELLGQLFERNRDRFKNQEAVKKFIEEATTDLSAIGVAKLIDETLGKGTFRTLSFLDAKQDSARSVYKLLKGNIESSSFEKMVEKGYYLNLLENYGVEWTLEKVSRDAVQNFFDANGHTLDGVDIKTSVEEVKTINGDEKIKKQGKVIINAPQDYDWRELVHFGGTTKKDSPKDAGGYGEGLKIAAFASIRDFGAAKVKAASRDWEINYYFDKMPKDSYGKPVKGFFAKKSRRDMKAGNYLEIIFEGEDAAEKIEAFKKARELFYGSNNPDFKEESFNDSESGGFKVLPPDLSEPSWAQHSKGHLYLAGQRTHYNDRGSWDTLSDINLWTWKKVQPKDRDRGMITISELKDDILPMIVESMAEKDLIKSVNDFKPLWDRFGIYSEGEKLLEMLVEKLAKEKIALKFESEFLANDINYQQSWLSDALKSQGFKMCGVYMNKIGMKKATEQFKDLQSHSRVEADKKEQKKIELIREAAEKIGLSSDEIKEVWVFSEKNEKNIFSGQYNGMFYWLSREYLSESFFNVLNVYFHEAAHKEGPHGDPKFEYNLEQRKQKITQFILEHKEEWDAFEKRWKKMS